MSSRPSRPVLHAPGALSSSVGAYAPGRHAPRPELTPIDERLVVPESHTETETLQTWSENAAVAETTDDVFG